MLPRVLPLVLPQVLPLVTRENFVQYWTRGAPTRKRTLLAGGLVNQLLTRAQDRLSFRPDRNGPSRWKIQPEWKGNPRGLGFAKRAAGEPARLVAIAIRW